MKAAPRLNKEHLGVGCFIPTKKAEKYVLQVLRSGRLSYGPFIKRFERKFAKEHNTRFAVMVNSGTSALRIAFACLKETEKWSDGDEILVPATTFIATANTVTSNGLKVVFVDVDPKTYNIDPEDMRRKISTRTRGVVPVHLMGLPADMKPIQEMARKHKLKIVEDSCETMFAKYRETSVGSLGDIACFSTYIAHMIVTGVGGLALTNNPKYAKILRSLANHGRDNIYISIDDGKGKKGKAFEEIIARRFRFVRAGFSFRVTEFEGALGCAELEGGRAIVKARQKNAAYLIKQLKPLEQFLQLPTYPSYSDHAFMLFPLVLRKGPRVKKRDLVNFLESRSIETRDLMPLINQPYIRKNFSIRTGDFPVADWLNTHGFYIGCHQVMRQVELDYIVKVFFDFYKSHGFKTKN
ncbi:DegT/DnrJ/EryC1/StrS family aminotransferase [Candidatus Kaiserbacteria bacterium]|nr:DegT/DnrJ/EryC1/StrS family aminotransferase [Candidatus Kaiserbacteria bacterium]